MLPLKPKINYLYYENQKSFIEFVVFYSFCVHLFRAKQRRNMLKTITVIVFAINSLISCGVKNYEAPIEISASELVKDYGEDTAESERKFAGQVLLISGNISHYAELNGIIGVYLEKINSGNNWQILCLIDKSSHPDSYSKIRQKRNLVFAGRSKTEIKNNFIWLENCEIK